MSDDLYAFDEGLRVLSKLLVREETLETTLKRIIDVARRSIPDTSGVSISLTASPPSTAVATTNLAERIDRTQYAIEQGPAMTAMATREPQYLDDASVDARWPGFVESIRSEGIASALAVPLVVGGEVLGVLNVYAAGPGAFPEGHRESVQLLADQAGVAVANATTYNECGERVRQLQEALDSRVVIEQAKGVVMARKRCDAESAFDQLRQSSQRRNEKLRVIAAEIVRSAVEPSEPA